MSHRWRERALARGPLAVAGATAILVGAVVVLRYLTYHSPAFDLGFFNQVATQTARGRLFATSFVPYSFLGEHWEPLLGVLAQLDRIAATPLWLLAFDVLAAAAAPLAAARLARTWLPRSRTAPLVSAVAIACCPLFTSGVAFDYHTEALTPAVALFALDAVANRRLLRFVLLLLLLATIKEDALLVAAGVGWIAWRAGGTRAALAAAGAGLVGFVVVVLVVMPYFRGGSPGDLLADYGWLAPGSDAVGPLVAGAFARPGAVVAQLASAPALHGVALALLPLALLPLASGWASLGAVPALLVPLLSVHPGQAELSYQYGLEAAPLLLACALLGWRRVARRLGANGVPAAALLAASLAGYALTAPFPGGQGFNPAALTGLDRRAAIEAVLRRLPATDEVSAQTGLVAHVSGRPTVWEFPGGLGARYVLVDALGPVSSRSEPRFGAALRALPRIGYRVVAEAAGVTLWKR